MRLYPLILLSLLFLLPPASGVREGPNGLRSRIMAARNLGIPLTPEVYQELLTLQQRLPIEPYAEIITTPAPLSHSPSRTTTSAPLSAGAAAAAAQEAAAGAAAAAEPSTNTGLQFSDKAYMYTLLGFCVVFGGGYLYLPFVANSPTWERSFLMLTASLLVFYVSIAAFINAEVRPPIALSVSGGLLLTTYLATLSRPEVVDNLTAFIFGSRFGLLGVIPGFIRLNSSLQKLIYWIAMALGAACLFSRHIQGDAEKCLPPAVNKNLVSSCVCAWLGLVQIVFGFALKGLILETPFEPVGFFTLPVKFDYFAIENFTMLILLTVLGVAGYQIQQKRDKLPLLMETYPSLEREERPLE